MGASVEVHEGRQADVGGVAVTRLLPNRVRRTVGAWCFVDRMGPATLGGERALDVGPHPHIGLQTVTWLLRGSVLHRDSLGSEQLIRPGQLNLMTAGDGVAHSEETRGVHDGELHGVQLWVALPSSTRGGAAAFEHHAELPRVEVGAGEATVLVGSILGATSPARRDTEHLGVDLDLRGGPVSLPLVVGHEHAVAVLDGMVSVHGTELRPGALADLGTGHDELVLHADGPARVLVLGGEPFPEDLVMWWNYVARSRDEVTAAHRSWLADDGRFGAVASPLARALVDGPPWRR